MKEKKNKFHTQKFHKVKANKCKQKHQEKKKKKFFTHSFTASSAVARLPVVFRASVPSVKFAAYLSRRCNSLRNSVVRAEQCLSRFQFVVGRYLSLNVLALKCCCCCCLCHCCCCWMWCHHNSTRSSKRKTGKKIKVFLLACRCLIFLKQVLVSVRPACGMVQ